MEGFASVVANPCKDSNDIFAPEWVGVQSRGMKRWISIELSKKFGIFANFAYFFPRDIIDRILLLSRAAAMDNMPSPIMQNNDIKASIIQVDSQTDSNNEKLLCAHTDTTSQTDAIVKPPRFNRDIILWKIMDVLPDLIHRDEFQGIRNYISNDTTGIRRYQIAEKIARIFDDYEIYRPEMIFQWNHADQDHFDIRDTDDMWQPVLWKRIMEQKDCGHLAEDADLFFKQNTKTVFEQNKLQFPKRISFFGLSSIPPLFLKILDRAASCIDINLFLLLPSKEFFGYITSAKQMIKISETLRKHEADSHADADNEDDFYLEQGNPLLASMGASIRDFSMMIEDTCYYNEPFENFWYDPMSHSDSMLSRLQSDILFLVHRGKKAEPVKVSKHDKSISIHSCHGPMREAQVLKDQILDLFTRDSDLKPHDIIVMMPDIESYAPYIESVFSVEHSIDFTISDRKKRLESEIIETFLEILDAADSRLTLTQVLDILMKKSVRLKFNFSEEEIVTIKKTAKNAGICWGMDSLHRKHMGFPEFNENTWWFGLQRLMLGYAMAEGCESLFMDILPCESFEGKDAAILGKFTRFCDILFKNLKKLTTPCKRKISKWCDDFRNILFAMTETAKDDKDSESDEKFILEALGAMRSDAANACYSEEVSFEIAMAALNAKLDLTESSGTFLSGGMVFCNLMPMRSIPFKVVALMGMNDGSFPRQSITESFDIITKFPLPGDRIQRDEEKYLFLEALLSARNNFIITYTGMSIKDNSIIPPAGVVNEFKDTIYESFILPDKYNFIIIHPLQPFSEKYFKNNEHSCCFSFSKHYMHIAKNLNSVETSKDNTWKKNNFITGKLEPINKHQEHTISVKDLISFFRMPGEYFIKTRIGIMFPEYPGFIDDREPLEMDGLENYIIGQSIIDKKIQIKKDHGSKPKDIYPVFKASGRLPHGEKGKIDFDDIKANAESVYSSAVEDMISSNIMSEDMISNEIFKQVYSDIRIGNTRITGTIGNITDTRAGKARHEYTFAKFSPGRILKAWIYHLVLNIISNNEYPVETHMVVRSQKPGLAEKTYFPPVKDPVSHLSDIIDLFHKGMSSPLPFFPETSWAFAEIIFKSNNNIQGRDKADTFPLKNSFSDPIPLENILLNENIIKKAVSACMKKWHDPFRKTGEKLNRYIALIFKDRDLFDESFNGSVDKYSDKNWYETPDEFGNDYDFYNFMTIAMKIFFPVMDTMKKT